MPCLLLVGRRKKKKKKHSGAFSPGLEAGHALLGVPSTFSVFISL
jgi:hypothetical protein